MPGPADAPVSQPTRDSLIRGLIRKALTPISPRHAHPVPCAHLQTNNTHKPHMRHTNKRLQTSWPPTSSSFGGGSHLEADGLPLMILLTMGHASLCLSRPTHTFSCYPTTPWAPTSKLMFSPSRSQSSHRTSHWAPLANCSSCVFRSFLSCIHWVSVRSVCWLVGSAVQAPPCACVPGGTWRHMPQLLKPGQAHCSPRLAPWAPSLTLGH